VQLGYGRVRVIPKARAEIERVHKLRRNMILQCLKVSLFAADNPVAG
jgi:hypothetical protein